MVPSLPRPTLALSLAAALLLGAGCNSGKGSVEGEGADGGDGGDGNDGNNGLTGDNPVILEGTIYCTPGSDSSGYLFFINIQADDPQGSYTIADLGGWFGATDLSGDMVFEEPNGMACREGECVHSFNDGHYPPVTCSTHADYIFLASVEDTEGHSSEVTELTWVD